jgi:hypothetical protein
MRAILSLARQRIIRLYERNKSTREIAELKHQNTGVFPAGILDSGAGVGPGLADMRELLTAFAAYHLRDVGLALQAEHKLLVAYGVRAPFPALASA